MKRDLGWLWHVLGGLALAAAATFAGLLWWVTLVGVTIGGVVREVMQHDLRLTRRQWIEGRLNGPTQ